MDRLLQSVAHRFAKLDSEQRWQVSALFWLSVGFVVHYLFFCIPQPFFIEDSGISFAYAKHFAEGEGFVTYPGGERVEGFSNPLWTFLMAACHFVGLSIWVSAKVWGAIFGVGTLPFVYGIIRRANIPFKLAMLAPLLLVLSPNFVIWCGAGLENSLYGFLLAFGLWRLLVEAEESDRYPLSAVLFCLVCMTRPEGVMYAFLAAIAMGVFAIVDRRWLRIPTWIAVFVIPFGLYQWWRYEYFGWPYPNTYYAKLGKGNRFKPFGWNIRGWKYILKYLTDHHVFTGEFKEAVLGRKEWGLHLGWFLPLLTIGMNGFQKGWRRWLVGISTVLIMGLVLWDGHWKGAPDFWDPIGKKWVEIRVLSILLLALVVGLTSLLRTGWRARSVMWLCGCSSVFFVVYSGGDWMKAHRWFHTVEVFMLPVLLIGAVELVRELPFKAWNVGVRRISLPHSVGGLLLILFSISEIQESAKFVASPETTVADVHRRVRYMQWVQRRLDVDHVTLFDVDMGAHMMYSGWDIVDTAGLVDVPIARHSDYNRKFIREYVLKERKPDFAHSHGGWARTSKVQKNSEWKRDYLEISGYPVSKRKLHIGNHVRRDLFIHPKKNSDKTDGWTFKSDVRLSSVEVPSPHVTPGGALFIEQRWGISSKRSDDVLAIFALVKDGRIATTGAFQPGYRWYDMTEWDTDEVVVGKFPMPIPKEIEAGSYQLWLTVLDQSTGDVLVNEEGIVDQDGLLWVTLDESIQIDDQAIESARTIRGQSLTSASNGQCLESWKRWKTATHHVHRNRRWRTSFESEHEQAVARCFLERAKIESDPLKQQDLLLLVRKWDHNVPGLLELAQPIAAELDTEGQQRMASEEWGLAYETFAMSIALDPTRSHTRRRAEEARDKKLNIVAPHNKEDK
jgi:hypothetical protein